jgi:hypothetical protein
VPEREVKTSEGREMEHCRRGRRELVMLPRALPEPCRGRNNGSAPGSIELSLLAQTPLLCGKPGLF